MNAVNKSLTYWNQHISWHPRAAEEAIASAIGLTVIHSHHWDESTG